jgi:hypothetical protein
MWWKRRRQKLLDAYKVGARMFLGMQTEACASQGCEHCRLKLKVHAKPYINSSFQATGEEALKYAP